jgi:putative sterol carrier protein
MSTQEHTIEEYFPTEPWLETYGQQLDNSDRLSQTGSGWGVGWEGGMVFHIQNVPLSDRTIADLPEELVALIEDTLDSLSDDRVEEIIAAAPEDIQTDIEARPGTLREQARAELLETPLDESSERMWPAMENEVPPILLELIEQTEEHIVDGSTVFTYLGLHDGGCPAVDILTSLNDREYGFVITGDYEQWKALVNGDANVINQIMSGEMEVDGDMQKILQYSDAAVVMTETSAEMDSRFLF